MDNKTANIIEEFLELRRDISRKMKAMTDLAAKHAESLDITENERLFMKQERIIQAVKSMTTRLGLSILEAKALADMYRLKCGILDDVRMTLEKVS